MSTDSLNSQSDRTAGGQVGSWAKKRRFFQHRLFQRLRRHSSPGNSADNDFVLLPCSLQTAVEFNLKNELYICKRKLVSKCEALGVLCRELDKLREEREEFKALAQQAHARCQIMRRALGFGELVEEQMKPMVANGDESAMHRLLFECIEHNKALQVRNAELQESLDNVGGDMRLLRDQMRLQSGGCSLGAPSSQQFLDPRWVQERCQMAQQLEQNRTQLDQLQADLRTLLDEKEELIVERDALKGKYDRVNCELNYMLKGDAGRILDIDAVVMENRYLQERLNQMEEERAMAYQAVSKYKSMLERHRTAVYESIVPQTSKDANANSRPVVTQATVKSQLASTLPPTVATLRDLQNLARALLDTIQDRNLALTHQRKANRLLADRVAELERQFGGMECSGYWRNACSVFKARSLDDVRNLFPERVSAEATTAAAAAAVDSSSGDGLDKWPCRDP